MNFENKYVTLRERLTHFANSGNGLIRQHIKFIRIMKHKVIFNIVVSALILLGLNLTAQNETKIWYFGANAGLDFNTSPPTLLTNGALNTQEGCSSIADANGNLLFYTDGVTIWNKQHAVMANGTGLFGHQSTTQAALIVKQPGASLNYYVFTLDAQGYVNGLRYSVVDMNLAAGIGSVTAKNVLLHTPSEEKLAATLHANGTDVWIMTHDFNSINFRCFLLTSAGVSTNVVISTGATPHDANTTTPLGAIKFSHNSKKLGVCVIGLQTCELYDFNANTGLLSNPIVLSTVIPGPYGCEFSSDNSKFYAGSSYDGSVYQWNLCAGTSSAIINSQYIVYAGNWDPKGSLQIASDGKIYLAKLSSNYLATINNPNASASACNYVELGQLLSAISASQVGLPNFVSSFF
ncbi:MAG: WD40 repeat domain-containing protein, partial [Bacteroidia bacterium]|nr:WD40 repeat domain-containing protein [Bacteroidia bacterium]